MKFLTYLHSELKLELSTGIVVFHNGIYETNNNEEIEELKNIDFVFIDEAFEFQKELYEIREPISETTSLFDEVKKAGRPKKNK